MIVVGQQTDAHTQYHNQKIPAYFIIPLPDSDYAVLSFFHSTCKKEHLFVTAYAWRPACDRLQALLPFEWQFFESLVLDQCITKVENAS